MLKYIIKRIIFLIPTVLLLLLIVFLLIHLIPGDPAMIMLGEYATEEGLAAVRESLGLDKPLPVQFVVWLGNLVSGDLGASLHTSIPVTQSIMERFPVTLSLAFCSMLFSLAIALPSGVLASVNHNTYKDYLIMLGSILAVSIPGFWLGLMSLMIFSLGLGWIPVTGFVTIYEDFWQGLKFLILPSISLGFYMAAVVARMTRSSMLEVLRLDYITHARAKGLSEWKVIAKHALKNASAPTLTTIGMQFGMLLGGTVVTETVFGIPGLGKYLVVSIYMRDYQVVQGCILFVALIYIFINLIVDILYPFFDPRIEYH